MPELSVPKDACWPVGGEIDIATAWGKGRGGPGKRAGTVESGTCLGLSLRTVPVPILQRKQVGAFPNQAAHYTVCAYKTLTLNPKP